MNIKTLVSFFILSFSTIGYASTVTPTSIKLNPTAIHDITITATQGVQNVWQYEFNITGGDPYMLSMPITAAIGSANHVLTFEYQSNMAIGFEVFYSLNQTDIIGGRSRVLGNLEATGTGVWRTASFDIAYDMSRFGWGNTVGDFLRFDFGSNGSGTFKIRNIHITNYDYATSQQRAHKTININSEGVYFIQAEDYDNGGVGVAYYNRTTGTSTYRDDSNLAAITSNSAYTAISDMGNDWDAYTLGAFIDGSSNKISTDAAIQNWGAWYNYTIYASEDIDVDISIRAGVHYASWGAITTYGAYKSYGKARGTASPYGYTVNQIGEDWVKRYSAAMVLSLDGKNLKTVRRRRPECHSTNADDYNAIVADKTQWKCTMINGSDNDTLWFYPNKANINTWTPYYQDDQGDFDYVRVHLTKGEHTFKVTSLSSQWVFDGIRITPAQDEPIAQSQYDEPTWDTETDTWVAVDGLGRKVADSDDITRQIDNEAKIGMFYYVWHGQHGYEYKDNTKFMEANPASPPFGPIGAYHWSGEPALGYYAGGNPYVIAKHMQMLVDAGVDFYFFDVTNSYTYNNNVKKVIDEIDRRAALGLKTPKLVFTVNTSAADVIKNLFNTYYSNPKYDKYWFYYEGKPLMLVDKNALSGVDGNIINAFTMRKSWAFMEGKKPNEWSWLEFYPQQPGRNSEGTIEQISVSTAQHAATKVGKSYTGTRSGGSEPQLDQFGLTSRTPYGDYVEQQWQRARDVHPKIVMYTQWNEWIAIRFKFNNETFDGRSFYCPDGWSYFVDVFNQEFSRDIEPSKNSLIKDNYYMQFVSNVRKYRGVKPIAGYKQGTVINLDGNFSQWNNVTSIYRDDPGDCLYSHTTDANSITQAALDNGETNDIVLSKVAHDRYNLYFYVKTSENLNNYDSHEAWMQLYLNTDSTYSSGWNGYDFMIGKDLTTGNYALKQYNGTDNSYSWTTIGDVRRFTSGNELYFAVPLNKLNLAGTNFHIDFKWADNLATTPDVLDFITQGDVAPNARFNYRYKAIASTDGILMGDVNCDGIVNVNDITAVVAKVLGGNPQPFNNQAADLNNDTTITVADVTAIVRLVLAN